MESRYFIHSDKFQDNILAIEICDPNCWFIYKDGRRAKPNGGSFYTVDEAVKCVSQGFWIEKSRVEIDVLLGWRTVEKYVIQTSNLLPEGVW